MLNTATDESTITFQFISVPIHTTNLAKIHLNVDVKPLLS
jgi:hypothetical protein